MSRRAAEKEIEAGSFTVNGEVAVIGQQIEPEKDIIKYKGARVRNSGRKYYIALNKPAGYVTTANDEMGRQNVCELVSDINARLYPVGRLDMYSEGLLILTDDGEFANRLMHPSHEITKTYHAWIAGRCSDTALNRLCEPFDVDGYETKPAEVEVIYACDDYTQLSISIHEGRNRQIRKMCEQAGLKLTKLRRVAEGKLKLGDLRPGKWRALTERELQELSEFNS